MSLLPPPSGDGYSNPSKTAENGTPPNSRGPRNPSEPTQNRWSVRVATVSGIPIHLHFTFFLVIIWFALADIDQMGHVGMLLSVLGLFFCVALHELGHSLTAQRLGYPVVDITLYPIGGVASIEGSPRSRHELLIAVAGPAVNVVIAAILFFVLRANGDPITHSLNFHLLQGSPLAFLYRANVMLVLFNMIPAFPMDGGRVLRAALALFIGKFRATQIAATIGQLIAVVMGLTGLGLLGSFWSWLGLGVFGMVPNFGLVLIALFVFFAAAQERDLEMSEATVDDARIEAAMVRDFRTLTGGDTLRRAAQQLLETNQQDFPVVQGDEVQGVLTRNHLLRALAAEGELGYVAGAMERNVLFARPEDPLNEFLDPGRWRPPRPRSCPGRRRSPNRHGHVRKRDGISDGAPDHPRTGGVVMRRAPAGSRPAKIFRRNGKISDAETSFSHSNLL